MKRTLLSALLLAATVLPQLAAQDSSAPFYGLTLSAELGGGYTMGQYYQSAGTGNAYDLGVFSFDYTSPYVDFGAGFRVTNDGKYAATEGWMSKIGNQYFLLDEGYTRLHFGGLSFEGGFIPARSTIDTPYEVFLNPEARATLGMAITYEDSLIQYQSRWISVNMSSSNTYDWAPGTKWSDKGVNYRLIAVKLGDLRVGYEESSVYLRTFDANYFLSPLPSILTNTLLTQGTNPWTQGGGSNDNSLMGLFADYKSGPLYTEAQFLVDDINLNFLTTWWDPSLYSSNLDKFAWSIGGSYKFSFGTIGFWHGGATAYTYEATYSDSTSVNTIPYEYMYLPTVVFNGSIIDPRDSNVGFQWGENAIAFRLTYDYEPFSGTPWEFQLSSHLEYVIKGSSSPDNPWNIYSTWSDIPYRIELFDVTPNEVLEQYLILHTGAKKQLGDFQVSVVFDIGGDFNSPQAYTPAGPPVQSAILQPILGNNKLLLALELGVRYTYSLPAKAL
jgi:hypothetical protein